MPFGKYRDCDIRNVPRDYLLWVLDNVDIRSETLKGEIRARLGLDTDYYEKVGGDPQPDPKKIIREWYRTLVMKYHPDRGGSHDAMVAINDAVELLKELFAVE